MARQLGKQLVDAGILSPELLAKALERQKTTGQKLGECLVRLGLDETPVLRLLAQQFGTRFVSTTKLAQARIEPALAERVPVRLAEGFDFVPIRLDGHVLYVAMAEPQRARALEEIAKAAGVKQVVPFVAIRRSVRAAIRKLYYSDANAFESTQDENTCPHCGAPVATDDFQCSRCELLLVRHADDLPERDNVSLVRALLTEPDASHGRKPLERPNQERTTVYTLAPTVPSGQLVPTIVASFELVQKPLNPFEAYVMSYVDGRTTVAEIAQITQLKDVELRAIFESLAERGLVDVPSASPPGSRPPPRDRAVTEPSLPPVPDSAMPTDAVLVTPPKKPKPTAPNPIATPATPPPPLPSPGVAISQGAAQKLLMKQAAQQREESAADSVLQRAVALERGGRIDEAVDLLSRSIGTLKNPAPLYNRLGLILLDQHHDYDRASALLRKATELEPENSVYMMNLYAVLSMKAEATDAGHKRKPRGK